MSLVWETRRLGISGSCLMRWLQFQTQISGRQSFIQSVMGNMELLRLYKKWADRHGKSKLFRGLQAFPLLICTVSWTGPGRLPLLQRWQKTHICQGTFPKHQEEKAPSLPLPTQPRLLQPCHVPGCSGCASAVAEGRERVPAAGAGGGVCGSAPRQHATHCSGYVWGFFWMDLLWVAAGSMDPAWFHQWADLLSLSYGKDMEVVEGWREL